MFITRISISIHIEHEQCFYANFIYFDMSLDMIRVLNFHFPSLFVNKPACANGGASEQ